MGLAAVFLNSGSSIELSIDIFSLSGHQLYPLVHTTFAKNVNKKIPLFVWKQLQFETIEKNILLNDLGLNIKTRVSMKAKLGPERLE